MIKKILSKFGEKKRKNFNYCLQVTHSMNRLLVKNMNNKPNDGKHITRKKLRKGNTVYKVGQLRFQHGVPLGKNEMAPLNNTWVLIQLQKNILGDLEWVTIKSFPENYNLSEIYAELLEMRYNLGLIENSDRYK